MREEVQQLAWEVAVGNPQQPSMLLVDPSQTPLFEDVARCFIAALLSVGGVRVISPADEKYEQVKEMVGAK